MSTRMPPPKPETMPIKVNRGVIVKRARNRGSTSASNGSTPMTCMASTSWFIFMAPSSAAKLEADRPAKSTAVIKTPNSRSMATPINSTVNTEAPNWVNSDAPRNATVAPMKKLVTATIGKASSPALSISETVAATRMRPGLIRTCPRVVSRRPKKALV